MKQNSPQCRYIHFSITPVQQFITSGRRTRDFWAGSFLLSLLCAVGQRSITHAYRGQSSDELVFQSILPEENQSLVDAFVDKDSGPQYARLPNRFSARVPIMFDRKDAALVIHDIYTFWNQLWQFVFDADVKTRLEKADFSEAQIKQCYAVWQRQLTHYWDIQWVITDSLSSGVDAMASRKLFRAHVASDEPEPGVKCNYFAGLQEMSGMTVPRKGISLRMTVVQDFWTQLRTQKMTDKTIRLEHDVDDEEMLSAVAYFKRRFAFYFEYFSASIGDISRSAAKEESIGWQHRITNWLFSSKNAVKQLESPPLCLRGWSLDARVPSVTYLSAVDWLLRIGQYIQQAQDPELVACLKDFVRVGSDKHSGQSRYLKHFQQQFSDCLGDSEDESYAICQLDGNSCYDFLLQAEMNGLRGKQQKQRLKEKIAALNALKDKLPNTLRSPDSYYAVIALDGDRFGQLIQQHMNDSSHVAAISQALHDYTGKAEKTVAQHHGFLVYAGGEDLVALLPGAYALNCVQQLHDDFTESVHKRFEYKPTISAAVQFNHVNVPLMRVLRDVQQLLSGVAKRQYGRNAVAIRIVNQDGMQQQWGTQWPDFFDQSQSRLYRVIDGLRRSDETTSNRFLYQLRQIAQRMNMLDPKRHEVDHQTKADNYYYVEDHQPQMLKSLIVSQYLRTQNNSEQLRTTDLAWLDDLYRLCEEQTKIDGAHFATKYFNPDIAFIAKFLSDKVNCRIDHGTHEQTRENGDEGHEGHE